MGGYRDLVEINSLHIKQSILTELYNKSLATSIIFLRVCLEPRAGYTACVKPVFVPQFQ